MGLYDAINAYIERGDEVLVIEPTWVSFSQQVEMAEGIPVAVPLSEEEEYYITYEHLKEYVTPQSRMLIINNPNNPTGRVYTQEELEAVAQVATEHDLLVVCDETYEYFTYDGNSHLTVAALEGMAERTLTSYTFTKAYSMAGWRLGCIVASRCWSCLQEQKQTPVFFSFVRCRWAPLRGGPPGPVRRTAMNCASDAPTGFTRFLGSTARFLKAPPSFSLAIRQT